MDKSSTQTSCIPLLTALFLSVLLHVFVIFWVQPEQSIKDQYLGRGNAVSVKLTKEVKKVVETGIQTVNNLQETSLPAERIDFNDVTKSLSDEIISSSVTESGIKDRIKAASPTNVGEAVSDTKEGTKSLFDLLPEVAKEQALSKFENFNPQLSRTING